MRVLHVLKTGLGATWAVRQVGQLCALGVDVHVALPPGPRQADFRRAGATVHTLDMSLPVRRPHTWPRLRRDVQDLVDHVQPDVLHSHFVSTTMTARLALRRKGGMARVFNVPGPLHLENPVTRRAEVSSAHRNDYWLASCKKTQDTYVDAGIDLSRVGLAYYGVDPPVMERDVPELRRELGLAEGQVGVGMIAFMYAPKRYLGQRRGLKGHEDFIDAMAIVRRSRPDATAVMVGGAWNGADAYADTVTARGRRVLGDGAVFIGTRPGAAYLYRGLDVAVHPSHSENLGGAAESLMYGVPTVATRVGGFPDLVLPGQTGLLAPPHDPQSLAAAILQTLEGPDAAHAMAVRGRQHAERLLDQERNARVIREFYDHMLSS